jgi:hypothetical protein
LLGFSLITCRKSNLCTTLYSWNVTQDNYYLTHAKVKHDCTSAQCIFNLNTSVTVHKQDRSHFSSPNNCQGQLKTLQSISVRIFLRGRQNLTYLLTPWNRVLLEKLTGFAASQEIPRIYGNRKFITVSTSARHLSLVLSPLHPVPTTPSHFLKIHLNIILPSTSGSPQWCRSLTEDKT